MFKIVELIAREHPISVSLEMSPATRSMVYFGLIGLLIAGSVIAVFQVRPILSKDGTISIYFANTSSDISGGQTIASTPIIPRTPPVAVHAPENPSLNIVSLDVTIDSVMIHRSGEANDSGWMQISHGPITLDLLKPTSVSTLIASARVPQENITMVRLHVSRATAAVKDASGVIRTETVVVSSDKLEIPLRSDARVKSQMTTSITVERPHIVIEGNGRIIRLTPVLNVNSVNGPK